MTTILIVEKLGSIKEVQIKNCNEDEFYKKAGYKTNEGFKCFTKWNVEIDNKQYFISLYGKTTGRANQENKYEFPPPMDKLLFFGNCILVHQIDNKYKNLTKKEWEEIYEKLYGGFEDIGEEDSEDEYDEDEDDLDETKLTKTGYLKDDFIVDDDEDEDEEEEEEEEEEDEDEDDENDDDIPKIKTKVIKSSKKKSSKKLKATSTKDILIKKDEDEPYLDCKSELSEESYIE